VEAELASSAGYRRTHRNAILLLEEHASLAEEADVSSLRVDTLRNWRFALIVAEWRERWGSAK